MTESYDLTLGSFDGSDLCNTVLENVGRRIDYHVNTLKEGIRNIVDLEIRVLAGQIARLRDRLAELEGMNAALRQIASPEALKYLQLNPEPPGKEDPPIRPMKGSYKI
ncbi:hypothetical protein SK128_006403, partial [Halocaridina rubra]